MKQLCDTNVETLVWKP